MLQRKHPDYLMKRVEELAKVLARLLGFKDDGLFHDMITISEETLNELFDTDFPLDSLDDLEPWLEAQELSSQDLVHLADITFERAEALRQMGENDQQITLAYQQAWICMNYVLENKKVFPFHWATRVDYLKQMNNGLI